MHIVYEYLIHLFLILLLLLLFQSSDIPELVWKLFIVSKETWNNEHTLRLLFCVPTVIYLYDLQMSIDKHFFVDSSNLNLEIKIRLS